VQPILEPIAVRRAPTTLDLASQRLLAVWAIKTVFLLELAICQRYPDTRVMEGYQPSRSEIGWLLAQLEQRPAVNDREHPQALFSSGAQHGPASCTLAQASFLIIPEPERPRGGLIPVTLTVSRCRSSLSAAFTGYGLHRDLGGPPETPWDTPATPRVLGPLQGQSRTCRAVRSVSSAAWPCISGSNW